MIFGVGTDIVELSRIQSTYERFGEHFVRRILMEEELELFREIDEVAGTGFYAVGINLGGFGSQGPTTLARVQFTALTACQSDELCWLGGNPKRTTLADMMGLVVPFEPCCSGDIFVNSAETTLTCPSSAVLTADPGSAGSGRASG